MDTIDMSNFLFFIYQTHCRSLMCDHWFMFLVQIINYSIDFVLSQGDTDCTLRVVIQEENKYYLTGADVREQRAGIYV